MYLYLNPAILGALAPKAHDTYVKAWVRGDGQFDEFGITRPLRFQHFMAQVLHESLALRRLTEDLTYTTPERLVEVWRTRFRAREDALPFVRNPQALADHVYGNRTDLGNTQPGDGWKYRGRGAIQITGQYNYWRIGNRLGLDLVAQPELLIAPEHVFRAAAAFWELAGCNRLADVNDWKAVSKRINPHESPVHAERGRWLARVKEAYEQNGPLLA